MNFNQKQIFFNTSVFYQIRKIQQTILGCISKLEGLEQQLKDKPISESMMVTKILRILRPRYNHFYSAWESTTKEKRTLINLTFRLMMEESRILIKVNFIRKNIREIKMFRKNVYSAQNRYLDMQKLLYILHLSAFLHIFDWKSFRHIYSIFRLLL